MLRKRARAEREILDATRDVLLRDGADAITIERISSELGMSRGALYYYFDSKDALIDRLLTELVDEMVEAMAAAARDAAGIEAVTASMTAFVDHFRDSLDTFRALFVTSQLASYRQPETQERINASMRGLFLEVATKLEEAQRAGEAHSDVNPRRFAVASFATMFGVVSMMSLFEMSDTKLLHEWDDLVAELTRVFRRGAVSKLADPDGSG